MASKSTSIMVETSTGSKLNHNNYTTWKFSTQAILEAKGLWDICKVLDTTKENKQKNAEAKALIWNTMEDVQKARVGNCETAHDLWVKIQDIFEGSQQSMKTRSLREFLTIKMGEGESLLDYCSRYETLLNKLESTGYFMDEKTKIWAFKNSLPDHLYEKCDTWEMVNSNPTASELVTLMRSRDRRSTPEPTVALYAGNAARRSNPQKKSTPSDIICNYCKIKGHKWKDCRKKKSDDKRKKTFAQNKTKGKRVKPEQAYMANEDLPSSIDINSESQWYIDSGATKHMTAHRGVLSNYTAFKTPHAIYVGNGNRINAYGMGFVVFNNGDEIGKMVDVLYTPELTVNLFSVKQSMKQGFEIIFKEDKVEISRNNNVKIAGRETERGLFEITLDIIKEESAPDDEQALVGVSLDDWHKRFAHANHRSIKELHSNNAVDGLEISSNQHKDCVDCAVCKVTKTSHPSRDQAPGMKNATVLHFDTVGPLNSPSLGGNKYFVLATDQNTGFKLIKFARSKDAIPHLVIKIIVLAKLISRLKVRMIVSDNGTEYVNNLLRRWLSCEGILHEVSTPSTPQQNGLAERANRTIIEGVRTLLVSSGLPERLWSEAAATVVYTSNRMLSRESKITKFGAFTGMRPSVKHLRIFGQYVVAQMPSQKRYGKWSPVGKMYRLVGYTDRSNTYRLYDEEKKQVITACDVKFLHGQQKPPQKSAAEEVRASQYRILSSRQPVKRVSFDLPESTASTEETQIYDYPVFDGPNNSPRMNDEDHYRDNVNDQIHREIRERTKDLPTAPEETFPRMITRSISRAMRPMFVRMDRIPDNEIDKWQRGEGYDNQTREDEQPLIEPGTSDDDSPNQSHEEFFDSAMFSLEDEPITVKDALNSSESDLWQAGMDKEMDSLVKNGTWVLVDRPKDVQTVKSKWVFKKKIASDGRVGDYKARLVAKGYSQVPGIDYKETFAPVAQMNTIRMLFALANQFDLELVQFDVKTAFLYGDLDETIYMDYPEGYENPGNKVCKLVKSLYGLKQSPRQWNKKFDEFLKAFNLKQSINDRCLYYSKDRSIFLTIYVDDGLIAAKDATLIKQLTTYLREHLEIKEMACESYLGFQVKRDRKKRTLILHQQRYIERILDRFNMPLCNSTSTPEEVGVFDSKDSEKLEATYPFKEAIGSLLYLVTCTRPDVAHAVSIASRTSEPTMAHWHLIKRILRYLSGTKSYGIRFRWEKVPQLKGYCDADYANEIETRRSTSGYGIAYGGTLIAWRCQRQPIVSLSTTEAEYISGCELVKDLLPIREVFIELGIIKDEPVTVYIDNLSAVHIAKNAGGQQRTKHIDVRQKWLSEQHESGKIAVEHIPGDKQLADMLTKPLHKTKFQTNRNILMAISLLTMLAIAFGLVTSFSFKPAPPVFYEPSKFVYFKGYTTMNLTFTELNPCKPWFQNITTKEDWNSKLVTLCNDTFVSSTLNLLKNCKEPAKGQVTAYRDFTIGPLNRSKRFIPVIAAVFQGVGALGSVYAIHKAEINEENINIIHKEVSELREVHSQAARAMNEIKNTIHDLVKIDNEIIEKLDFLEKDAEVTKRVIYLISRYETYYNDISDKLRDVNRELPYQRFSPSLIEYVQRPLWQEPAALWSSVNSCSVKLDAESNMILNIFGKVPERDIDVKILSARFFKFWNRTSSGDYCWMRYSGPRLILANTTNNCFDDLDSNAVIDGAVHGLLCGKKDQPLRPLEKVYVAQGCFKNMTIGEHDAQVLYYNGDHLIYCPNSTITINSQDYRCPEHIFSLSTAHTIKLERYSFTATANNEVIVNSLDRQLNEDINQQLSLSDVRIRIANTSRLDEEVAKLNRLMSRMTGRDFRLVKPSMIDVLSTPFKLVKNFFDSIWNWIEIGFFVILGGLAALALIVSAPLIEIAFKLFSWTISSVKRLGGTIKCKRPIRRLRRRMKLDNTYVVRQMDDDNDLLED